MRGWMRSSIVRCLAASAVGLSIGGFAFADDAALAAEIRAAQVEAARSNAKVASLSARKAALEERWGAARDHADAALRLLRTLPRDDGVVDQILMIEGILARVEKHSHAAAVSASTDPPGAPLAPMTPGGPSGSPGPAPGLPDQPPVAGPTLTKPVAPDPLAPPYPDSATLDDHDAAIAAARAQARQQQAIRDDEVRLLTDADATRLVPQGANEWVSYPQDWPEKARRRAARYPGGLVARSSSWTDGDGKEWYMGVYDIQDLIYVAPDFVQAVNLNPVEQLRTSLDRDALRWRFFAFGGWPQDIAAALPLLDYFGGVDDFVARGPKFSVERQKQIEEMVRVLLGEAGPGPKVISVPPLNGS